MKIKVILLLNLVLLLCSCGSNGVASSNHLSDLKKNRQKEDISNIINGSIKLINRYRDRVGLQPLTYNKLLSKAANLHAEYLVANNKYSHFEGDKSPAVRAMESGYKHSDIAENIYASDVGYGSSLQILFSNIYHRLSFLDFGYDEIGLGYNRGDNYQYHRVYVYELGHKNSRKNNTQKSPKIIIWPYRNQQNVTPVFYEEEPDPLPECGVSGYPVSIQFNPQKSGQIVLKYFELLTKNGDIIDSKLLFDNEKLTKKEYVLMPLSRLEADTTYHVRVGYYEDGDQKEIEWDFHTKANPYTTLVVDKKSQIVHIKSSKTYYIYLRPKDCNDKFESYTYTKSSTIKLTEKMIDNNTILIKALGKGSIDVMPDNGREFKIMVN